MAFNDFIKDMRKRNDFRLINGGEGGIRTHGPRKGTPVFETDAFSHSATSPHP